MPLDALPYFSSITTKFFEVLFVSLGHLKMISNF